MLRRAVAGACRAPPFLGLAANAALYSARRTCAMPLQRSPPARINLRDNVPCPDSGELIEQAPDLAEIPPAPPSSSQESNAATEVPPEQRGVSVADFAHVIPTFFVPVDELLKRLPGYTTEHVNRYIVDNKTVQAVRLAGYQFVRIHGGDGKLDLTEGAPLAADDFKEFRVCPSLASPFVELLSKRWKPGEFVGLRALLEAAPKEAVDALPYGGPLALLYFAQMQHMFAFVPDQGGAVMLLPAKGNFNLGSETSPCPVATCECVRILSEQTMDLSALEAELSEFSRGEAVLFFGSLANFFDHHRPLLHIDRASMTVCTTRTKHLEDTKKLSLEEQLQKAIADRDKKRVRRLRKKLNMLQNPDNPLLDSDNLAKAIHDFLPGKGHVRLVSLIRTMPYELLDLLPKNYHRFFKRFPSLFHLFEFKHATNWCIMRASLEIPPGALRREYTDNDVLQIVAGVLTKDRNRPSRAYQYVLMHTPYNAKEYINNKHGSLHVLLRQYPQYFSLVFAGAEGDWQSCSVVLVDHPPVEYEEESDGSFD